VNSAHKHRRPRKRRRPGRHAAPSQLQKTAKKTAKKTARQAGKAAPAAAIAGVLAAGWQAQAAVSVPASAATVVRQIRTDAAIGHDQSASQTTYTVQPGDTLSSIAKRFYGNTADWQWIYDANKSVIRNPDLIYVGQVLILPDHPSPGTTASAASTTLAASSALSGTLDCAGLEDLWEQAGGSPAEAVMAASIAMAESGGEQYATGPYGEEGYWQINPHAWADATYDPIGNAKDAIQISDDGTDWDAWTTYLTGANQGRC
jgi:LysM repeat protein